MSDGSFGKYLVYSEYEKYTSRIVKWIEMYNKIYRSQIVIFCIKETSH